ncbi:GNAT family N-acetyltransferase [uncultured Alsobacter sp.]|uniref:GNAT family N-acetyltransferase n=1 Tax=uncultured Alsobacter sp. TaxID=1748258 RepID=UPI0025EB4E09|nr:GNAT family N-acetyltransferase [uncultured Alsobacter sp.]
MTLSIEKLSARHDTAAFTCGNPALDAYLARHAQANQAMGAAQTYVALADGTTVVGYFSLVVGSVLHEDAPDRLAKGLARHPVPVMVLARLAVARDWQGRGLGAGLLKNALQRTSNAADIAGIRAVVVHAKDDDAVRFYKAYGFAPWPSRPLSLYLLLKDLKRIV